MPFQHQKIAAYASAVTVCIALLGCGGGSSSSTAATQPNTPTSVLQASGNATQYSISSPTYTTVTGNYTDKMRTAVSFSTATPLSPNLKNVDIASHVSTLNIDDGLFSGSTGSIALVPNIPFLVSTDAGGNVTAAKLKVVSTLTPASVGSSVSYYDIDYDYNRNPDSFRIDSGTGGLCTEVKADICVINSLGTSTATATGTPVLSQNQYANYTGMYVFGDSDSDNGRRFALVGYPMPPFWKGRHSDGPVGVEYLASSLGIPLNKRTDFAVGGATTGTANVDPNPKLANTGMLGQLETFKQQLNGGKADPNALYFIRGGVNDFSACGDASCTTAQINQMVSNIDTLVKELYGLGARNILLSGVGNGPNNVRKPFGDGIKANYESFKAANAGNFYYFNYGTFYSNTVAAGNPYGFTTHTPNYCYTGDFSGNNGTVCAVPASYAFWDSHLHWTTRAMHAWGDSMAELVKK